jgi:transposase InsO family protein
LIPPYLRDFDDVFAKESFDSLPEQRTWDHAIELEPGAKPSACKVYPLAPSEQLQLDEFLRENLRTGRIRPSKSPMASPVFFIKKKDGSLRLVQDYRVLNAMTVKNRYPLPIISELIAQLRGAKYFTKLDVRWGFNNVRVKEGDEWKAAFRTNRGLYEPLVMFFGLTNSPATFQTMMNDIFQDLIMEGHVCVYLDDILIFTETLAEHRRILRLVLERLRLHRLYLRPEKCEFERTRIEYLGLIVSQGKVEMDPVKVAGVMDWPVPKNRKEVQAFLGFANFYRRFVEGFSHHARPLFELTKKDSKWSWGEHEQQAFDGLKQRFTSAPILLFANDDLPYRLEADSSDVATGAVLSQKSPEDDKWHPIAFYSKSLTAVERNYEIHDKEMLAIVRALEEWRHFLEGSRHRIEIWTDHKNLEYFRTAKKLNRRQARWSLYLSRFDFELHHRPGVTMGKSDALSRRSDHGSGSGDNSNLVLLQPELFVVRALEGLTLVGEERGILREVRKAFGEASLEDEVSGAVRKLRESGGRSLVSAEWAETEGVLTFRGKVYVPDVHDLRRQVVAQHHDSRVAGHPGRWKTLELVSRNYWWPHMSRYIGEYTKTCDLCLRTKARRQPPLGELHPLPVPDVRWDTISVDFIVELPEAHGYDAVMNVVDSVSKRAHFIPTNTTITAAGAARLFLHHVWKLHGLPRNVVSDRGVQFVREFTRELYRLLAIRIAASTAYHPQTDGQTERVNQELEQYLRIFVNERQDDWDDLLPMAEFQYNNHVHASTRQSPFMLDTGRHPRMGFEPHQPPSHLESVNEFKERMEESLSEARAALTKAKDDMSTYYNRRREPAPIFAPGDKVYLDASDIHTTRPSQKLAHRRLGPYAVERRVGLQAYRLRLPKSLSRLHPVFPVIKLTPAPNDPIPGRQPVPPPPPVLREGEEHFEVERVLDSRMRANRLQFLIKWKGYGYEENSWENERDVQAPDLIAEFYRSHPGAPRRIRSLEVATFRNRVPVPPVGLHASGRRILEGG